MSAHSCVKRGYKARVILAGCLNALCLIRRSSPSSPARWRCRCGVTKRKARAARLLLDRAAASGDRRGAARGVLPALGRRGGRRIL